MTDYLRALNPEQLEAVETLDGPLLVLAGAGTGKTRVLTTRFAHILMSGRAYPGQVLAVTFTNKAAREMRERVSAMLGRPAEGLWLGTFHALCARMLRRHAEHVGLKSNFNILDADDQLRLLKQIMEAARLDQKRFAPQAMMALIQRWKDRGLTPARITAAEDSDFAHGRGTEIYEAYQARLRALNVADFGDLLLHMTEILRTQPDVLAQYHRSFRYILVDEYQDTNLVQYLWLRLLAQAQKNICCVGDDDQSIYSWRGAEIENILRFEKDFPGARIVRLERNYRSTAPILAAASALIANNEGRLGKTLRSGRNDSAGEKISVVGLWDSEEEARMVAGRMEDLHRQDHALAEMAVLVRAGFQTRAFEERLIVVGLPYRVIGGLRFYERQEIRDAIAYLRVLHQAADDLAFERIVNVPRRGVGDQALRSLHEFSRANDVPLAAAAEALIASGTLRGKVREGLRDLLSGFARWREQLLRDGHVTTLATMLDESGYTSMWQQDKSAEAPGRLENLKELVRALSEFDTLAAFLDHVSLVMENEENGSADRVSLMTSARRQRFGIRHGIPAGLGRGLVPQPAHHGRERSERLGGGTPPRLCRAHARAASRHRQPRRQPPRLLQLAEQHPEPVHRRTARSGNRAQRLGGIFPRKNAVRAGDVSRPVPAGGPPRARRGSLGDAGASGPGRGDPGRQPRVPPKIRLRNGDRGRRPQARHRFRKSRAETPAGQFRRACVTPISLALETLRVTVPEAALEAYEAAFSQACGTVGFFLDDATGLWTVEGVKPQGSFSEPALQTALALAAAATGVDATVTRESVAADGWLSRMDQSFPEQRVGRIVIRGTHLPPLRASGRITLVLDAAAAFGSGEHGSTRGCLRALQRVAHRRPRKILDLGTGTGILAMAAARLLGRRVRATDIDSWAVRTARDNVRRNQLLGRVAVRRADGFASPWVRGGGPYNLVLANILARPLCRMAPALAANLAPGGTAILSGLLERQAAWVVGAYRRQGLRLEARVREGEWTTLIVRETECDTEAAR